MNLLEMFADYIARANAKLTVEDILRVVERNHFIADENGFIVFAWVLDAFHALFAYAAPGKSFAPINEAIENLARANGIKCIKFSTDRPEVFGRLFHGYKPVATILEKRM